MDGAAIKDQTWASTCIHVTILSRRDELSKELVHDQYVSANKHVAAVLYSAQWQVLVVETEIHKQHIQQKDTNTLNSIPKFRLSSVQVCQSMAEACT